MRTEDEVDALIDKMIRKSPDGYIRQAIVYNINCPRNIGLLKKCLLSSVSQSALAKEALTLYFNGTSKQNCPLIQETIPENDDVGNFI